MVDGEGKSRNEVLFHTGKTGVGHSPGLLQL